MDFRMRKEIPFIIQQSFDRSSILTSFLNKGMKDLKEDLNRKTGFCG